MLEFSVADRADAMEVAVLHGMLYYHIVIALLQYIVM